MKISLKELRETMVWLKIIARKNFPPRHEVVRAISECHELIAFFFALRLSFKNQQSKIDTHQSNAIGGFLLMGLGSPTLQPGLQPFLRCSTLLARPSPQRRLAPRRCLEHRKKFLQRTRFLLFSQASQQAWQVARAICR
jgi:hypothetical protein